MEIEECQNLGMTSNVAEMKKKMIQMQQNVADDDNIVKALQAEADAMRISLMKMIKEFKATGTYNGDSYKSILKRMESTIDAIL